MKTNQLELAVVEFFDERRNLIIPNVSWGFGIDYEADLMVLTQSDYLYEVELKVSRSDLKADLKKRVKHNCGYVKRLYYGFPEKLLDLALEILPDDVGLLVAVVSDRGYLSVRLERKPKERECKKITLEKQYQLARLGALRIWNLKRKIQSRNPNAKQVEINFQPNIFDELN